MDADIFAPAFKTTPYWWEAARPSDEASSELPSETDVAIIGSGYSGLSAALELGRAGSDVTVFEQNEIGWGASSRNGGMLSTEPKFASPTALERRFGASATAALADPFVTGVFAGRLDQLGADAFPRLMAFEHDFLQLPALPLVPLL